jgi:hypothetical protein
MDTLFQHLPRGTEAGHERSESVHPVSEPRFESRACRMWSQNVTTLPTRFTPPFLKPESALPKGPPVVRSLTQKHQIHIIFVWLENSFISFYLHKILQMGVSFQIFILKFCMYAPAGRSGRVGGIPFSYYEGPGLKAQLGDRLPRLRFSAIFLVPPANSVIVSQIRAWPLPSTSLPIHFLLLILTFETV